MPIYKRNQKIDPERKYLTTSRDAVPFPDLIEVQKNSYDWFLKFGVKELFEEVSPITDFPIVI